MRFATVPTPGSKWNIVAATAVAAAFVLASFAYLTTSAAIENALRDRTSGPTRDLIGGGLAGVTIMFLYGWTRFVITIVRRLRLRADADEDSGVPPDPVLYLRSFADDEKLPGLFGARISNEELLTEVLSEVGPVVAIGEPNERLPPLGAQRIYAREGEWRDVVATLMRQAVAVVIRAGVTPGVRFEVQLATRHVDPRRVLISGITSNARYKRFAAHVSHLFPRGLPDECGAQLMTFDGDWSPQPLMRPRWKRFLGQGDGTAAGITESLGPFCARLGVELSRTGLRSPRVVGAVFLLIILAAPWALWSAREPLIRDIRVAVRNPNVSSDKGMFAVTLPAGWDTMPDLAASLPVSAAADRLFVAHVRTGHGGFAIFADIQYLDGTDGLEPFVARQQRQYEADGALKVEHAVTRQLGAWTVREFGVTMATLRHVVLVFEAEGGVFYVRCWSRPEFVARQQDVRKIVASLRFTPRAVRRLVRP